MNNFPRGKGRFRGRGGRPPDFEGFCGGPPDQRMVPCDSFRGPGGPSFHPGDSPFSSGGPPFPPGGPPFLPGGTLFPPGGPQFPPGGPPFSPVGPPFSAGGPPFSPGGPPFSPGGPPFSAGWPGGPPNMHDNFPSPNFPGDFRHEFMHPDDYRNQNLIDDFRNMRDDFPHNDYPPDRHRNNSDNFGPNWNDRPPGPWDNQADFDGEPFFEGDKFREDFDRPIGQNQLQRFGPGDGPFHQNRNIHDLPRDMDSFTRMSEKMDPGYRINKDVEDILLPSRDKDCTDIDDAIKKRNVEMRRQFEFLLAEEKKKERERSYLAKTSESNDNNKSTRNNALPKKTVTAGNRTETKNDSIDLDKQISDNLQDTSTQDTSSISYHGSASLKLKDLDILPERTDVDEEYLEKRNAEMRREFMRLMAEEESRKRRQNVEVTEEDKSSKASTNKEKQKESKSQEKTDVIVIDDDGFDLEGPTEKKPESSSKKDDMSVKNNQKLQKDSEKKDNKEKSKSSDNDNKKIDTKEINKSASSSTEKKSDLVHDKNKNISEVKSSEKSKRDRSRDSRRKKSSERSRKRSLDRSRRDESPLKKSSSSLDRNRDRDRGSERRDGERDKGSQRRNTDRSRRSRSRDRRDRDKAKSKDRDRSKSFERDRINDKSDPARSRRRTRDISPDRRRRRDDKSSPRKGRSRSLSPIRKKKKDEPKIPAIEQLRRELDQEARSASFIEPKETSDYRLQQPSATIIIRCLALSLTEDDISMEFQKCDVTPLGIRLIRNKVSGTSRGFAFVDFDTVQQAQEWMEAKQGRMVFQNRYLATMQYSPSDWHCQKCLSFNFRKRDSCFKCGESRYKAQELEESEISATPTDILIFKNLDTLSTKESVLSAIQQEKPLFVGNVKNIHIGIDGLTNTSNGTCYVEITDVENAMMLYNSCQEKNLMIDGRKVTVAFLNKNKSEGKLGCVISAPATLNFKKEDIPSMAEYSASLYAKTPQEKVTYLKYYKEYYENLLKEGQDLVLPKQNQADSANAAAAVAQWAIQRVMASRFRTAKPSQASVASPAHIATKPVPSATKPKVAPNAVATFDPLKTYPPPNGTMFEYDDSMGYYLDRTTGLYYDAASQYFLCAESKQVLCYDPYKYMYVTPTEYSQSVAAHALLKKDEESKNEPKNEAAKKVVKEMEKWAKTLKTKKDNQHAVAQKSDFLSSEPEKKTADIGFAVLEREELKSVSSGFHLKNVPQYIPEDKDDSVFAKPQILSTKVKGKSRSTISSFDSKQGLSFSLKNKQQHQTALTHLTQYGSDSDEEEDQTHDIPVSNTTNKQADEEEKLFDFKKILCLLCKRKFQSLDILMRHKLYSDLHRENLSKHQFEESRRKLYML